MAPGSWALLIGLISTFMYTCLSLYYFVYLLYKCGLFDQNKAVHNSAAINETQGTQYWAKFNSPIEIFVIVGDLMIFIAMIVASIFLQIAIKKELVKFFNIWLGLSAFAIGFVGLTLIFANSFTKVDYILNAIVIVVQALMWYPIYVHRKHIRHHDSVHLQRLAMQQQRSAYCGAGNSNVVYGPTTELRE